MNSDKTAGRERELRAELGRIYTPGTPIKDPELFSGRQSLLEEMRNQLDVRGKVIILYGDRGVGKTSFCNVLLHGRKSVRYSCTPADNFVTIFLNILRELGIHLSDTERTQVLEAGYELGIDGAFKVAMKGQEGVKLAPVAPERLDHAGVLRRLKTVHREVDAIVFDEAQRLRDSQIHAQLGDLLKMFSDEGIDIRVIFIGIAETDEELLPPDPNYAEYKLRHYTTARIPPMTEPEIRDIVDRRQNLFKIRFDDDIKVTLAAIASGYPSIAHTLAFYSCAAWLGNNASALAKNWALSVPFIGKWLRRRGHQVEDINMYVSGGEFARGVGVFLSEFGRNYVQQTAELAAAFADGPGALPARVLEKLVTAPRDGQSLAELAESLDMEAPELPGILDEHLPTLVASEREKVRLAFSRLAAVIDAWRFLAREAPEELARVKP